MITNDIGVRNMIRQLRRLAEVNPELSTILLQDVAELEKTLPDKILTPQTAIVVKNSQDRTDVYPYSASITGTRIVAFGDTEGQAIARALECVKDLEDFRNDIMGIVVKQITAALDSP